MPTRFLAFPLALLLAASTHADFNGAITAYQNKQFEAAYTEFKQLAELGDTPSQRNLAAMYARGEHVEANLATAWAWAKLATEDGEEANQQLFASLDKKLKDDSQRQHALSQADALLAQFGKRALANRLLPVASDRTADCSVEVRTSAVPLRKKEPSYPRDAAFAGVEGYACFTFYVSNEGKPVRLRAYDYKAYREGQDKSYEKPDTFVAPSLKVLPDWLFLAPATEALRAVPTRFCMSYRVRGLSEEEYKTEKAELEVNQLEAGSGDPHAKYKLSQQLLSLSPQIDQKRKREKWQKYSQALLLDSARGGYSEAQYNVAANLLTGNQCEKDVGKGVTWLMLAAQQGHVHAQYLLGSRLMYGDGVEQNSEKAMIWLRAAAENGHERAKVEYALHLLQHEPGRQNEALGFLPEQPDRNDISQLEAAALGNAFKGDFTNAATFQQQALDIANEVGLETTKRFATLEAFKAGKLPELGASSI